MTKIKLWYPNDLFDKNQRGSWFELIKSRERCERKNNKLDGTIQNQIEWVDSLVKADALILPLDWSYYYARKTQKLAIKFCEDANSFGKIVLSNSGGDQGITVPVPENTIVYRQSGYRSKKKNNEKTTPFFLSDPVSVFLHMDAESVFQKKPESPVVGFCGMAPHGSIVGLKERIQIIIRNLKSLVKNMPGDMQEVMSSSNLRYKTLEVFRKSEYFKANYLIRQKYRGGVQTAENRKKTTDEYYQNQLDANLVICVRGVGNFSLRFYETLAMGRIPIFIDTDSPLPEIGGKDWNDYIIWVDSTEIEKAPVIAKNWLAKRNLLEQQKKNRELWKTHFKLDGFWLNEINKIVISSNY